MVWLGSSQYRLAAALGQLWNQLVRAYPGQQWQGSPQTGTIGDVRHEAEDSSSDHNPWLAGTVRALDIAADVTGVPGIQPVSDAPDCEALFGMVNAMFARMDSRIWPDGYGIYRGRITDPTRPGRWKEFDGDPHLYHLHISVSTAPAGYNSTAPWPLPRTAPKPAPEGPAGGPDHQIVEDGMYEVLRDGTNNAHRAGAVGYWRALNTPTDIANALNGPLLSPRQPTDPATGRPKPRDVSHEGMQWWHDFYTNAGQ